jgi:hypothetical protein
MTVLLTSLADPSVSIDSNINIQMNYWSADMTNLDVSKPLFDYFLVFTCLLYLIEGLTKEKNSIEKLGTPGRVHGRSTLQYHSRMDSAQ